MSFYHMLSEKWTVFLVHSLDAELPGGHWRGIQEKMMSKILRYAA